MPDRRAVLLSAAAFCAAAGAAAHTPYGQWVVYRQKHLMIGVHRGDGRTYALAKAVAAALAEELPDARARVARGPHPQRIASLLGTGQLPVAVLGEAEALRMAEAAPPFDGYRPVPLRAVAGLPGGYALYATSELPDDHARLLADALDHAATGSAPVGAIRPHPGAAAFWADAADASGTN